MTSTTGTYLGFRNLRRLTDADTDVIGDQRGLGSTCAETRREQARGIGTGKFSPPAAAGSAAEGRVKRSF